MFLLSLSTIVSILIASTVFPLFLLGIFMLTHPYSYAAGVNPDVFQRLLDASSG